MATSEGRIVSAVGVVLPFALYVAACGQVTGLSNDYRYDLEGDAQASDASDATATVDATAEAAATCLATDRARAMTTISDTNGANLSTVCKTCLADNCCSEIEACASNSACKQSMRCVFDCQKSSGNKRECISNCDGTFSRTLGTCVQSSCASPTCQLQ